MSMSMMTGGTPLVPQGKAEGSSRGPRRVRLVEAWKVEDLVVLVKEDDEEEGEEDPGEARGKKRRKVRRLTCRRCAIRTHN